MRDLAAENARERMAKQRTVAFAKAVMRGATTVAERQLRAGYRGNATMANLISEIAEATVAELERVN